MIKWHLGMLFVIGNVCFYAVKRICSLHKWLFRRLHGSTGWSSTPLVPKCSAFPESISTNEPLIGRMETILTVEVSWSDIGIREKCCLCPISSSSHNFQWSQQHIPHEVLDVINFNVTNLIHFCIQTLVCLII